MQVVIRLLKTFGVAQVEFFFIGKRMSASQGWNSSFCAVTSEGDGSQKCPGMVFEKKTLCAEESVWS